MDELKTYNKPQSKGPSAGYNKGKKPQGQPVPGRKATSPNKGMKRGGMDQKNPAKQRTKPC
jgi:hypothetical protein